MDAVHFDLKNYLQNNIFPSRTVLVFPPFNGFRRFLIHKLIEDSFAAAEVAAFSIGQDISRRIVVCYKGLLREGQEKLSGGTVPRKSGVNMIEREKQNKQKLNPSAAVYRPPAARLAEARHSGEDAKNVPDSKRKSLRRPDQQMYVPRPKRASYANEQPRSRSQSSSRTSPQSELYDKKNKSPINKSEELRLSGSQEKMNDVASEPFKPFVSHTKVNTCNTYVNTQSRSSKVIVNSKRTKNVNELEILVNGDLTKTCSVVPSLSSDDRVLPEIPLSEELDSDVNQPNYASKDVVTAIMDKPQFSRSEKITGSDEGVVSEVIKEDKTLVMAEVKILEPEVMETISISSDSRDKHSSDSITPSSESKSSDSSNESEDVWNSSQSEGCEKMEIEPSTTPQKKKTDQSISREQNHKNRRIFPSTPVSDVLIISDSSSSNESTNLSKPEPRIEINEEKNKNIATVVKEKSERPVKKNTLVNAEECDWESLYDDSGECLVPDLMEELTNSVGRVRVASVDSDYRPYQSIEERTSDGECVIEIYDFPAEFKTTDLFNIFAAYRNKNFQIKWVDDTHALGVFPSPLMADEVLACTLPFVKTRPLRLAITESRNKARNLILPPLPSMERPKTCTALARRLVSGALGLRLPTSSQEREKEKQVLKEAREKRRLEAKQREAAWEGTLTSDSCT